MTAHQRTVTASLAILLLIALAGIVLNSPADDYAALGFGMFMMVFGGIEFAILLLLGIVYSIRGRAAAPDDDKQLDGHLAHDHSVAIRRQARAFYISAVLVLLIGGSVCFGGMFVYQ